MQTRGSYNLRSVSPAFSSLSLNANLQCAALLALGLDAHENPEFP
jgi:hypothetical protein